MGGAGATGFPFGGFFVTSLGICDTSGILPLSANVPLVSICHSSCSTAMNKS